MNLIIGHITSFLEGPVDMINIWLRIFMIVSLFCLRQRLSVITLLISIHILAITVLSVSKKQCIVSESITTRLKAIQ